MKGGASGAATAARIVGVTAGAAGLRRVVQLARQRHACNSASSQSFRCAAEQCRNTLGLCVRGRSRRCRRPVERRRLAAASLRAGAGSRVRGEGKNDHMDVDACTRDRPWDEVVAERTTAGARAARRPA